MSAPKTIKRRRFQEHAGADGGRGWGLAEDHPASAGGTTLFPSRVIHAHDAVHVLKSGAHSRKIGGVITKGKWRGFPIFTLTLEERATCPRSCRHWSDCYGNSMPWPHRHTSSGLVDKLDHELAHLQAECPKGFVVRLHVLGDFFSVPYVEAWMRFLDYYPALHVFGYTAWGVETPIGAAVDFVRRNYWDRFAVRTSDAELEEFATVSLGPGIRWRGR